MSREEIFNGLEMIRAYFQRHSINDDGYIPEIETASGINKLISDNPVLQASDIEKIVTALRDIDNIEHANSSAWLDYKLRLKTLLNLCGFNVEFVNGWNLQLVD